LEPPPLFPVRPRLNYRYGKRKAKLGRQHDPPSVNGLAPQSYFENAGTPMT